MEDTVDYTSMDLGQFREPEYELKNCVSQKGNIMTTFHQARKLMAGELKKDEGLFVAYQANIAMLLHDHYGITDYETRNKAGADIIEKIFYDVEK